MYYINDHMLNTTNEKVKWHLHAVHDKSKVSLPYTHIVY